MQITPELVKEAYRYTNFLPSYIIPFNKKTGRADLYTTLYAFLNKLPSFVPNQRYHPFYDWDMSVCEIIDWERKNFKLAYRDGFQCSFEYSEKIDIQKEIIEEYTSRNVISLNLLNYWIKYYQDIGNELDISLETFNIGLEDGIQCRKLFKPIDNIKQKALVWVD